jgi:hypothetical protein
VSAASSKLQVPAAIAAAAGTKVAPLRERVPVLLDECDVDELASGRISLFARAEAQIALARFRSSKRRTP